mmetsp:Transcript_12358/g.46085  ORF Transcript_12358/g.46085 Transcript_12358/m.46085 type:complete len:335 (-) Transcript_12358:860-1864(-)
MSLVNVASAVDFDAHVSAGDVVTTHFWADWCEPCAALDQLLMQFARSHPGGARFLKVEAENVDDLVTRFNVDAVPFFTFHKHGKLVGSLEGADGEALAEKLNDLLGGSLGGVISAAAAPAAPAASSADTLDARLKTLTTSAPILLFMKGNETEPQCGFSRKVVGAIQACGVDFETFDILSDEEVRQGLKTFSDWPTYPQLYVNGELLGGCDIVLEMAANGELVETLKSATNAAKQALETRLKALIKKERNMVFIKGTKDEPRCGFSRKVVAAMTDTGHAFETFDILSDEDVRQGLKTLSDWPTYPQLYVNGELVGGCDIILEMAANGELKDAMA